MGRIISLSNQKGGVGKTTSAVNLASCLAEKGKKVLLIDLDPQGNAGFAIGINAEEMDTTIYEVLTGEISISDAVFKTDTDGLFLIPSNMDLAGAQVDLQDKPEKEFILKKAVNEIKDSFHYILIDCPPSLGILTVNSLAASDSVIIPLQCEYYALEGIGQLMKIILMVQESLNPHLELEGVLLTMFDSRTNLSKEVVADVRENFKDRVFRTIIPRNVPLAEAPSFGKPINHYDRNSVGSMSYLKLADEVIANDSSR